MDAICCEIWARIATEYRNMPIAPRGWLANSGYFEQGTKSEPPKTNPPVEIRPNELESVMSNSTHECEDPIHICGQALDPGIAKIGFSLFPRETIGHWHHNDRNPVDPSESLGGKGLPRKNYSLFQLLSL
jgi:hypothetical protein